MQLQSANLVKLLANGVVKLDDVQFEPGDIMPAFLYKYSREQVVRSNYRVVREENTNRRTILCEHIPSGEYRKFRVTGITPIYGI